MRARRTRNATIAAALGLAALVAILGAAQAAPPKKTFTATVHVTNKQVTATTATLTLTLRNTTRSQTLGSANFEPPTGVTFPATGAIARGADRDGWTASIQGGVVEFRSTSNPLTDAASAFVSADVRVNIDQTTCTDATWKTRAKQSNDFSGNPGNDFALSLSGSNLVPLGRFDFDQIGTHKGGYLVPQVVVDVQTTDPPVTLTAYDICGEKEIGYGSGGPGNTGDIATLAPDPLQVPARLEGATITGPTWASGVGTARLTATVVETGDRLVATDSVSGISANSDAGALDEFDVVKELCTNATQGTTCELDSPGGGKIHVQAPKPDAPAPGADAPSLGFGFNAGLENFSQCDGADGTLGGLFVNINPRDYAGNATVTVTLTYAKSIIGNGPASSHVLCLSKTNGADWAYANPVPGCETDSPGFDDAPCIIEQKKTTGGDLRVVLFIKANDPWGGMS